MIDIKIIRDNPIIIKENLEKRGSDTVILDKIIGLDNKVREVKQKSEHLKSERNSISKEIGQLKRDGKDTDALMEKVKSFSGEIKNLDTLLEQQESELNSLLLTIPNTLDTSVPLGKTEDENVFIRDFGTKREFEFEVKEHSDLGEERDIIDLKRAAKITGARFPLLKGEAALLERSLINFMLDLHTKKHGYREIVPPFMVNAESLTGTGQLPKFEEDLFKIREHNYYLVPTAEVPLTNIHRDEIIDAESLPVKYVAYTPCFRSEAGSYGKDTKGLIRQHQFNKVELMQFVKPENSFIVLEELLNHAETVLKMLDLPYRIVLLCAGETGFGSAKTYDIEVWMPSQNRYREISSCGNFTDFQARRSNIRFKRDKKSKTEFAHTLNGSGLAVGRTMIAIIENYQNSDGTITIPSALRQYMNNKEKI